MRAHVWKALLVFLACFAAIVLATAVFAPRLMRAGAFGASTIALINIQGVITSSSGGSGMLGMDLTVSSIDICDRLYRALKDPSVKAVVLRVDSPGGAAAGSDEIYRAVTCVREKKPVVVSMGDVAASGGYYVSSAASYVYANAATLTGSIGVIFNLVNWGELAQKVGVKDQTLTAGQFKDIGSPWRAMTDAEKQQLAGLIKQVHEQFIRAVAQGRKGKLTEQQVRKLATGMVYTGEAAAQNGLVDAVGGLHEAEAKARALAKVGEEVPVEEYGAGSLWDVLLSTRWGQASSVQALRQLLADPLATLARQMCLNATLRDLVIR
jgi:protease-4